MKMKDGVATIDVKKFNFLIVFLGLSFCITMSWFLTSDFFQKINATYLEDKNLIPIEYYVRIFMSALLGFIIGMDRSRKFKPIGLKTYSIISVGTCLITIISILSVHYFSIKGSTQMDPMRLVAQLLPAVGFVGAGTIWLSNNKVKGLTSAAFVFFACTIGIGIGSGFYGITLFTLCIVLITIFVSSKIEQKFNLIQIDDQDYD